MAAAVLVPWRPSDPHREAAWRWVSDQYATHHPTWQVITGGCPDGPWVKAHAVEEALSRTDADTLVIADADVWAENMAETVAHVHPGRWAVPHWSVNRLDESSTAAVLSGGPLGGEFAQQPYKGHLGGGVVCLHRADYLRVPLDPRFRGWGNEDDSWGLALTMLLGRPWRGRAPLWHLWHPPQPRLNRIIGSEESAALFNHYQRARTPEQMLALIEEGHAERSHRPQPQGHP